MWKASAAVFFPSQPALQERRLLSAMKIDKSKDRPTLLAMVAALSTQPKTLRRDGCGDWHIAGKQGHIAALPEFGGFQIYVQCRTARKWTHTKQAIRFAVVSQDGDDEGVF